MERVDSFDDIQGRGPTQWGGAYAPYKRFGPMAQNLGGGRIHFARACKCLGSPADGTSDGANGNINSVMDGDIDGFINAYLTASATGELKK